MVIIFCVWHPTVCHYKHVINTGQRRQDVDGQRKKRILEQGEFAWSMTREVVIELPGTQCEVYAISELLLKCFTKENVDAVLNIA